MKDDLYALCILIIWAFSCVAAIIIDQPGIFIAAVSGTFIVSVTKGILA